MNLAYRDIRHHFGRFVLTAVGIGLLLMVVMGMSGIYRGMVEDAVLLVERAGADLWIVQKDTHGPFAEVSRIPASLGDRLRVVPGVRSADNFVSFTVQRELEGCRQLRAVVQGLDWPADRGEWLPLIAGHAFSRAHYQMVADRSLGLTVGQQVRLGKDFYEVVGIARNMVSSGGDGMAFLTLRDAQAVQGDMVGESIRIERQARLARAERTDISRTQPVLTERALGPSEAIPALGPPAVSAVMVRVEAECDVERVRGIVSSWPDVSVYTDEEQKGFLLEGNVDRARRQIGLFRILLVFVSGIIMALIIYTLTLDKVHDIALLKLLGARNRVVYGLIVQQAMLLGAIGYGVANLIGQWVFPRFPRRVLVSGSDLAMLAVAVAGISLFASLLGIWKAMKVEPNEVLA
jgi:putative ABC transport system permease protein